MTSRREAEKMILAGRVAVNGVTAVLGQTAVAGIDEIAVDGVPLEPKGGLIYIMLNKPRGYITSMNDERGRKTVMDLVADVGARVYPVGRLDLNSEGLLLMTNDGQFANAVAHPSNNKKKTYDVGVRGDVSDAEELLSRAIDVGAHTVQAVSVALIKRTAEGGVLRITINEGRNRQIRNMCLKSGLAVHSLKRIKIGALELGSLRTGQWRHLTGEEKKALEYGAYE